MDATTGSPDPSVTQQGGGEAEVMAPLAAALPAPVAAALPAPVAAALPAPVAAPCPCQITFSGMLASEAPKVEVRAWFQRLGPLTAPMTGGRVLIEAIDQDRKERQYQVRLEISMPGEVVVVGPDHPSNGPHEDVYVAIRNAFRGARRELELHRLGPNGPTDLQV
jgi:hypothetical protein